MNTSLIIWKQRVAIALLLLCFLSNYASGQQVAPIDSLKTVLDHVKDDTTKIRIMLRISKAYNDTSVGEALSYAKDALGLSEKAAWTEGKMLAELAIGDCYPKVVEYDNAIAHYNRALAYAREINRRDVELKILVQLQEAYNGAGNFAETIHYKKMCVNLAHLLGDSATEYNLLNYIAGAYFDAKKYDTAIRYWLECLDMARTKHMARPATVALNNLGGVYIDTKKTDSAKYFLNEARDLAVQLKDTYTHALIDVNFCELYKLQHLYDSALTYGQRAIALANEVHHLGLKQAALKLLSETYEEMGKPVPALAYHKDYDAVTDSIRHEEKTLENAKQVLKNDFARQVQIYELERKSSEEIKRNQRGALILVVVLLFVVVAMSIYMYMDIVQKRRKNKTISIQAEQLQQQNDTINKALKEKEILLKEVHHRVKNNLQVISSLLELQSYLVVDENAKAALYESQARVMSMAIIHQKLYQDEMLDSLNFRNFADDLFAQIKSMSGNRTQSVKLVNELPVKYFEIDVAVPLGLILNELITNSFKYAYTTSGSLTITLQLNRKDEYCILEYSDDGQGLPEGVGLDKNESLGLQLVNRLSTQLGGYAKYAFHNGSIFCIYFLEC